MASERERFSDEKKLEIGERNRQLRVAMGLSQEEWAKIAKQSGHSAVSNWETGRAMLGLKPTIARCEHFGPWVYAWIFHGKREDVGRDRPDIFAKLPATPPQTARQKI